MRWEIDSAVIGTKLEAYFPDGDVGHRWSELADDLTDFYAVLGMNDEERRTATSTGSLNRCGAGDAPDRWGQVRAGLLEARSEMIRTVLAAPLRLEGAD
jgi:hypothetical protein